MKSKELLKILKLITIPDWPLAFSGGLDSAILAKISNSPLYTVGLKDSYDLKNAREVSKILRKELTIIQVSEDQVMQTIPRVAKLIGENPLDVEIAIPFYLLLRNLPNEPGLILGHGADELFGGYKRYEKWAGTPTLKTELEKDITELDSILRRRERKIAAQFGVNLFFPYLDPKIKEFAQNLPAEEKVSNEGRKLILRETAKLLHLPEEVCSQPKKAIQYGTGISKIVRKHFKEVDSS